MPSPSLALLRTQSDARLVALARDGHERAFEAIVERYRRQLLRSCRRVLPGGRAEDALQQTLMAAWRGIQRGDEVRELRPWLHRIAHNTSLNLLRQAGYDFDELRESLRIPDAPDDELERRAVVRQTLHGLAALPPRQREALLAIAVEGRSQEEVAGDLGLSTGAVRQLVHRARAALRTAATAVVPLPVGSWVAAWGSRGELSARVAELSAGAGGAGAAAALAKAGTVAVIAGGAVAGPALIEKRATGPEPPTAAASAPRGDRAARSPLAGAPRPVAAAETAEPPRAAAPRKSSPRRGAVAAPLPERRRSSGRGGSGDDGPADSGSDRSGRHDGDGGSGRSASGEEYRSGPSGDDHVDRSGPSGGSTELDDRSGSGGRSGSSGPGSGDDRLLAEPEPSPTAAPQVAEEPEADHSGPGSGGGDESGHD